MIPPPLPVLFLFYFFVQQQPPLSHIWHITLPCFFPISFFLFHFSALFLFFLGSTPVLFHFFGISDDSQPSSPHMLLCSFIFFLFLPFLHTIFGNCRLGLFRSICSQARRMKKRGEKRKYLGK